MQLIKQKRKGHWYWKCVGCEEVFNFQPANHKCDDKDTCPIHSVELEKGFCDICMVCYSCK